MRQTLHRPCQLKPRRSRWNRGRRSRRHLVVGAPVQQAPVLPLLNSAPLLEEESRIRSPARFKNSFDPSAFHRSRARTALAADNHPVDTAKVHSAEIFQKRLDTEKARA